MRDRRPTGAVGVLVVTAAIVVTLVVLVVGWADEERTFIVSAPQSPPLEFTPVVRVAPAKAVCLSGATLVPDAHVAAVRVGTRGRPGVPLTATLTAPGGFRQSRSIPGTWVDNDLLTFAFDPPARPVHGTFCLRNDGRRTVDVYAAADRTKSVAATRVDGRLVDKTNIQLSFFERRPSTLRRHVGDIIDTLTVFRPGIIGPVVVWTLFILTLAGLPLGVGFAMWRAVREPDSVAPQRGAQPGLDLPGGGGPRPAGDEVEPGRRPG